MLENLKADLKPGPVAVIINEDDESLHETIDHAKTIGFENVVITTVSNISIPDVITVPFVPSSGLSSMMNPLISSLQGRWIYWGYNAEYLFFPFCETRSIQDAVQFVTEERRDAIFSLVVDLYTDDLAAPVNRPRTDGTHFDAAGYFSRDRYNGPERLDRQVNVHGGLKWRFAEHVPWPRQPIERTALFRARPGLTISDDGVLSDPEMNTVSAAWHHSLTCAIPSFRAAKSLMTNPNSAETITSFLWSGSKPFDWTSKQLMDHGLMEPGQWF